MLSLVLFLILAAVVLGIIGFVVKGLIYLFVIGVLVFLLSFVVAGLGFRRKRRVR